METYRSWVEQVTGAKVVAGQRSSTGGSRQTWFVELLDADGQRHDVVLRVEGDGSFSGTEISLAREAVAYRALAPTAVPVPTILAVNEGGTAVLMTRASGTSDVAALGDDERVATMADFVDQLALLHQIPVETLDLPGFERPATVTEHATLDLDRWRRLSARVSELDPLIAYTGGWLMVNAPRHVARTTFVQGDTGPGNFVARDNKVTALVDMEFSHIGDPMDDLAWLFYRAAPLSLDRSATLARYAERSGIEVSEASIGYYELAVQYRCAVTTSLAVDRGGGARGLAPYVLQTQRYLDEIASRLRSLSGVAEPEAALSSIPTTTRTPWFDHVLAAVRGAVRGLADETVREDTRNSQIFINYLRAYDAVGTEVDAAVASELASVFEPADLATPGALVSAAATAGERGDDAVLRCLLRCRAQRRRLWAALLDRPRR